jgi:hypothetical protein
MANKAETNSEAPAVISVKEFLETIPPGVEAIVSGIPRYAPPSPVASPVHRRQSMPDLELHCPECDGTRMFRCETPFAIDPQHVERTFLLYMCKNCEFSFKSYAIEAHSPDRNNGVTILKYGESPAFGPPLPSKLIELIRPEWDYFQKGRRAENQGLGIGAFGYYRRVIENQKNRIFDELIKAATKLNAKPETLVELSDAKEERQFTKALESVKGGLPDTFLIQGQNPLGLLHDALSEGLHAQSDEECLQAATDVRVVMTELAERLSDVLKSKAEVESAVSRLAAKRSARATEPIAE